jgi:hypothetical protein
MADLIDITDGLEVSLALERSRLVGLCATLTGNADVAEDLAQETLLEAWRHIEELRDREKFLSWLSGITRIRRVPAQEVEAGGRPAIVTTFESVTNAERIVVVSALDTYETLRIERVGR